MMMMLLVFRNFCSKQQQNNARLPGSRSRDYHVIAAVSDFTWTAEFHASLQRPTPVQQNDGNRSTHLCEAIERGESPEISQERKNTHQSILCVFVYVLVRSEHIQKLDLRVCVFLLDCWVVSENSVDLFL